MRYLLTWDGAELVSVELDDDSRCVLVFDDRDEAAMVGRVVHGENPGRAVTILPLDASPEELRATLRPFLDLRLDLRDVRLLFPSDPLFRYLVRLIHHRGASPSI